MCRRSLKVTHKVQRIVRSELEKATAHKLRAALHKRCLQVGNCARVGVALSIHMRPPRLSCNYGSLIPGQVQQRIWHAHYRWLQLLERVQPPLAPSAACGLELCSRWLRGSCRVASHCPLHCALLQGPQEAPMPSH